MGGRKSLKESIRHLCTAEPRIHSTSSVVKIDVPAVIISLTLTENGWQVVGF